MIEIRGVTKKYGEKVAVNNLSLRIEKNSFVGLLGPNGAGKTTLIKMITSLLRPQQGEILVHGTAVSRDNNQVKAMLGIVPQHSNLEREMTVYEDLEFAAKLFRISPKIYPKRIDELLDIMELTEAKDQLSKQLSGGMQRKVMIAKALINEPQILLLDEPTVGIDVSTRIKIWDIMKDMQKRLGMTLLMTTHYIEEAQALCDRVCFMDRGEIFMDDHPEALIANFGHYTIEEFYSGRGTEFHFFKTREEAMGFSNESQADSLLLRELTLGDVFYHHTKRKVI